MAEYSREQTSQLSLAVAKSKTESRQLKEFMDNRIVQRTLKNDIHRINKGTLGNVSQLLLVRLPTTVPDSPSVIAAPGNINITAITQIITGLYPIVNAAAATACATNLNNDVIYRSQRFMYLDIRENGADRGKNAGSFSHCTGAVGAGSLTAFWKKSDPLKILMVGTHYGPNNRNYLIKGATNNMTGKTIAFRT